VISGALRSTRSIRVRLAIGFTVLVATVLVVVGVVTYQLLRQQLLTGIERDVAERAAQFRAAAPEVPDNLDTFTATDVFLQVTDGSGAPLARSGSLGDRTLPVPDAARRGDVVEVRVAERPLFLTAASLAADRLIVVARSPVSTYGALNALRQLLIVVVGSAVVLTALLSWLYARTALRPIHQLVAAARDVRDSRDLTRRVPDGGTPDEVGQLTATFNEMLAQLEQAYQSLDQSNDRLRRFLADCSHELRAPLARIRSTVDLLDRMADADQGDDAFRSRALADIAVDTDRMARMVRQLLILARADAGTTLQPRLIRLGPVVDAACRQAARMANGVTLAAPTADAVHDVVVLGDADHLEQVVLILLDNAFKYTPPPGEVRVSVNRDDRTVRVSVTDTGLGIPDEDVGHVFERFYRGRNASAATGTGLGLAIGQWIAAQHGGFIELSRPAGAGCQFTLHLPLVQADEDRGHDTWPSTRS
jgi:two-component system, OmpR family, sensor kinase